MMDIVHILQENVILLIAVLLLLLLLLYKKPKVFVGVFLVILITAVTFYLIINLSSTGSSYKKDLIEKSTEPTDEELF